MKYGCEYLVTKIDALSQVKKVRLIHKRNHG
jgi:hypothetical protein